MKSRLRATAGSFVVQEPREGAPKDTLEMSLVLEVEKLEHYLLHCLVSFSPGLHNAWPNQRMRLMVAAIQFVY